MNFPRDLDLPLDLDLSLEELSLFLSWEHPLTNKASILWISIFFYLISLDNKDETTSSKLKVVVLLPVATTKLSHDSGKEHHKMIHLSSSKILISTYNN